MANGANEDSLGFEVGFPLYVLFVDATASRDDNIHHCSVFGKIVKLSSAKLRKQNYLENITILCFQFMILVCPLPV